MTSSPLRPADYPATVGLVIAGGQARRMGGVDKMLIRIGGVTLVERAAAALQPGCIGLVINAAGDPARLRPSLQEREPVLRTREHPLGSFGSTNSITPLRLPVVADSIPCFAGPLAGILAGLDWTVDNAPGVDWVASVPTDCPLLPLDLVTRLHAARAVADADIAIAASGGRSHPVIGLWPVRLREALRHALVVEDERKVGRFAARYHTVAVEWPTVPIDPFFNVNTPEDVAEAERLLGGGVGS